VSTDEITDACGNKLRNTVIGVLKNGQKLSYKLLLRSCHEMSAAVNHNVALQTMWLDGVKFDVLLLATDTAPYSVGPG
jgi:hypothetical protein